MQTKLSRLVAAAGAVALAALGTAAQARDNVYWSIGVNAAPGVAVGVSNMRPMVIPAAPVYVAPAPVYLAPRPVMVVSQPVYYVQPAPVYYGYSGKHKGHKHKHRN